MEGLIQVLRWSHIVLGFVGLAAWWVPILSKKGGKRHMLFGKVFAVCAFAVGGSAMLTPPLRIGRALAAGASITDNATNFGFLIFLFYLGCATIALTHHAIQAVRTRRDPDSIRTPLYRALMVLPAVGSAVVIAWALFFWSSVSIIMLALSPVGVLTTHGMYKYAYRRPAEKMTWFYEHMGALLGAGIAFHTAFLVFGSRIVLDLSILGQFNWVPWVAPGVIGTVANSYWERYYRRKFGELPAAGSEAKASA